MATFHHIIIEVFYSSTLYVNDCAQMHLYKRTDGVLCPRVSSVPMACDSE